MGHEDRGAWDWERVPQPHSGSAVSELSQIDRPYVMLAYRAKAMRFLQERDRLRDATAEEIEQLSHSLRHEEFTRAIEPYMRVKNRIFFDFYMLQTNLLAPLPPLAKETLKLLDELITSTAQQFGY